MKKKYVQTMEDSISVGILDVPIKDRMLRLLEEVSTRVLLAI